MAKVKSVYFCQSCGAESSKWVGKCNSCGEWNTYVEELVTTTSKQKSVQSQRRQPSPKPRPINEIQSSNEERLGTYSEELNRVLGGGIVNGSLTLLGGEPGIGKSTLSLQIALNMEGKDVLYVSGEESEQQIKLRADRLGIKNGKVTVLTEVIVENILLELANHPADLVVIDSIQTLHTELIESSAGSISQIRECAGQLLKFAKTSGVPIILIGHITKDGSIAGPKVLEHMVDVVLQFEGDRNHLFRILRASKNRFGSTSEIGIYEMDGEGLKEVENPSGILINNNEEGLSGTAVCVTMEGIRPILLEVQALVSSAVYGTPQRSSTGFDLRRLNMLLAVLEKRCGFQLSAKDVFLNLTGGIKVEDPAMDLAVIAAILSSNENVSINPEYCFAGEVGLTGEIRPITRIESRIGEAQKLGFNTIFISKYNMKGIDAKNFDCEVVGLGKVEELFKKIIY